VNLPRRTRGTGQLGKGTAVLGITALNSGGKGDGVLR